MPQTAHNSLSHWLVVSDVDGTLNNKLRILPKKNLQAITRFTRELGGRFTLASGRNVQSLKKHYRALPIEGTPAIVLNGAGTYCYKTDKMMSFHPISSEGKELILEVAQKFPSAEITVYTEDHLYILNSLMFAPALVSADKLPHTKVGKPEEILHLNWGKMIFMDWPHNLSRVRKFIETKKDNVLNPVSTSIFTYEILAAGVSKGTAVKELAKSLGISIEHVAAIGDYYNDLEMLLSVGLPAACGQAPKALKDAAKFQAVHCNKGAVADLLNYIENNYMNI